MRRETAYFGDMEGARANEPRYLFIYFASEHTHLQCCLSGKQYDVELTANQNQAQSKIQIQTINFLSL